MTDGPIRYERTQPILFDIGENRNTGWLITRHRRMRDAVAALAERVREHTHPDDHNIADAAAWHHERAAQDWQELHASGLDQLDLTQLGPLGPFNPDGSVGPNDGTSA